MEDRLEIKIWSTAQQAYDMAAFVKLVERLSVVSRDILGSILPCGCTVGIGTESIRVLRDVMKCRDIYAGPFADYFELRSCLRMHLRNPNCNCTS